jgi:GNAT superfamily N-acetyltransferase
VIRDAETADLPVLARIMGQWCRDTLWLPKLHTPEEDLWFLGELHRLSTLRVIGHPALGFLARQGVDVDALYLAPEARRKGHGRALIKDAMAAEPVLRLWAFEANLEARAFYAALGFVEVGRTDGDNDEGLPDVRLEWRRDV